MIESAVIKTPLLRLMSANAAYSTAYLAWGSMVVEHLDTYFGSARFNSIRPTKGPEAHQFALRVYEDQDRDTQRRLLTIMKHAGLA